MFNKQQKVFPKRPRAQNNNLPRLSRANTNMLPPPPSYEDSIRLNHVTPSTSFQNAHTVAHNSVLPQQFVQSHSITFDQSGSSHFDTEGNPKKYLTNWTLKTSRTQLPSGNLGAVLELKGTLLLTERNLIMPAIIVFDAGILESVESKNVVKTNTGKYHLIGPIKEGCPAILQRVCLLNEGIPRTWEILLRQLTGMATSSNESLVRSEEFFNNPAREISKYPLLQKLLTASNNKFKSIKNFNPSDIVLYQFREKLIQAIRILDDLILTNIEEAEINFERGSG